MQDADRLDAMGAVGIMRASAFSGAKGRVLMAIDRDKAMRDGSTGEGHFYDKLLKLREGMKVGLGSGLGLRNRRTGRNKRPGGDTIRSVSSISTWLLGGC